MSVNFAIHNVVWISCHQIILAFFFFFLRKTEWLFAEFTHFMHYVMDHSAQNNIQSVNSTFSRPLSVFLSVFLFFSDGSLLPSSFFLSFLNFTVHKCDGTHNHKRSGPWQNCFSPGYFALTSCRNVFILTLFARYFWDDDQNIDSGLVFPQNRQSSS